MYKVFLVDDEELVIKSLKASVDWKKYGYEVVGFALSGEEAVDAIERLGPDVVFSDIRMPGMNGLELKKRLSDKRIDAKFMVVSGLAEFVLVQKAIQQGVYGYCLKPFDELEIVGYLIKLKKELDARKGLPEGEFLDLIESGTPEANVRLRQELISIGILGSGNEGLRLLMTVRRDKLAFPANLPCLTLRIGYRKFIYLLANADAETLSPDRAGGGRESSRGFGCSEPFVGLEDIGQAIREAELLAYGYFMAGIEGELEAFVGQTMPAYPLPQGGQPTIRYALQLYNDCLTMFVRRGREDAADLHLYSYEQLADAFGDVGEMIAYLKAALREEQTEATASIPSGRNQTFAAMLHYVNESFGDDISIQELGRRYSLNPNYISQLFRKELDKSFTEYLTGLRMERAAVLLRTTSDPINEIADRVGYKDYFYFSKMFKKTVGVPPKTYRNDRTQHGFSSGS